MYNLNHIIRKLTGAGKALLLGILLFATGTVWAQTTQTLKGRIVDTEGNPVAGARNKRRRRKPNRPFRRKRLLQSEERKNV